MRILVSNLENSMLECFDHGLISSFGRMKDIRAISVIGLEPGILIANPMPVELLIDVHEIGTCLIGRGLQRSVQGMHDAVQLLRNAVQSGRRQHRLVGTVFIALMSGVELWVAEDIDLARLALDQISFGGFLEKGRQALAEAVDGDVVVVESHLARLVVIAALPVVVEQRKHAGLERVAEHVARVGAHADGDEIRVAEVVADVREFLVAGSAGLDLSVHGFGVGAGAGGEVEGADSKFVAKGFRE